MDESGCARLGPGGRTRVPQAVLAERIDSIAASVDGIGGVAALDLATGEPFRLRGDERFPMASVYKLPIALAVLHHMQEGRLHPDSIIAIPEVQFAPHYSPLANAASGPIALTVDSLLALMLGGSDNTATDALSGSLGWISGVSTAGRMTCRGQGNGLTALPPWCPRPRSGRPS